MIYQGAWRGIRHYQQVAMVAQHVYGISLNFTIFHNLPYLAALKVPSEFCQGL